MSYRAHSQEDEEVEQALRPSRYRSVRKPVVAEKSSANMADATRNGVGGTDQRHESAPTTSISRSMSRYRRRAPSVATANNSAQTIKSVSDDTPPPVPALPPSLNTESPPNLAEIQENSTSQNESGVSSPPRRQLRHTDTRRRAPSQPIYDQQTSQDMAYDNNHDRTVATDKDSHRRRPWEQHNMDRAERDRLLEEQKKKDLQRLEEQLENSQRASTQAEKVRSPIVDKFVSLARGGKSKESVPSPTAQTTNLGRTSTRRAPLEVGKNPPAHIEPGGKGIVPQTDAPTSAINAGDRNVTVRCRHHTLSLPVTPETTPTDIISETSNRMKYDLEINAENCIVVEHYGILGLERRVRCYERIRDIMNSWDRDTQNQLLVEIASPGENHEELDVASIPTGEEGPSGCQLQMYQSNRPGKWNKRWITLLDNGQIVCAKKPDAKLADKDTASLCHLSDYDIYTPTDSQMKRHIKPPKRYCFAIKSQHKTTLFLNTEKYVQYFCTDDPQTAREFRETVFGWRSWYLADRRPEVRNKRANTITRRMDGSSQSASAKAMPNKFETVPPANGSNYAIGKFEPLIDMSSFEQPLSQLENGSAPSEQEPSSVQKGVQTLGLRLSKRAPPTSTASQGRKRESDDGFTGGLLGEQYEIRKQALSDTDAKQNQAFTDGPSLLSSQIGPEFSSSHDDTPSWFPSAVEHTAKQRSATQPMTVRPTTSASPRHERRSSLTAAARRLVGYPSSSSRPSTQHVSQQSPPHTQHNPQAISSQPAGLSLADRRGPPKPLVDLTPKMPEAPQWSKEKKGRGVKPPEGFAHLVDFITVSETEGKPNGPMELTHRNTVSRPTRSKSLASSSARPLLHDAPPMPALPQFGPGSQSHSRRLGPVPGGRDNQSARREGTSDLEREQQRARRREQEREYQKREAAYNAVPGRTGTLRVV